MATKDPVLSVRLPGDLDAKLTKCAEQLDLSKNDIARHAIRAAVAEIEANDFKITLPLAMTVQKTPVKSAPLPSLTQQIAKVLAADADKDSSASTPRFTPSVNEEPAPAKPFTSGPRARPTRAAITKLVKREKGESL